MSDQAMEQTNDNTLPPEYRRMPHNLELEQALLGAMLVNNAAAEKVQSFLFPEHFYEEVHGRIYQAILKLLDKNQSADPVRLKPYFENDPALEDVGGAGYLVKLATSAATIINAEDYGKTIHDMAVRRELISIGEEMVVDAYDAPIDVSAVEQIEKAEADLFSLSEKGSQEGGFQRFSKSLNDAIMKIESAYRDPNNLSGLNTGLNAINDLIGGMHPSDLVILAGRPAMGKTALATNIAFNIAKRYADDQKEGNENSKGAVVGFFSLEMPCDQLAARILSERAQVQSEDMRRGKLTHEEFQRLVRAMQEMEETPFFIDDTAGLSIASVRTRARRLKRQHNLGFIVIDYLQLLSGTGRGTAGESRVQEISEITRGLKALAKELHVPVLALSQLSRTVEARENKRPQLADLRESGSIEQDADMVMFVFREEYYKMKDKPTEGTPEFEAWQATMEELANKAECIVAKQRHGPTGTAHLHFEGRFTHFSDLAKDQQLPERFD